MPSNRDLSDTLQRIRALQNLLFGMNPEGVDHEESLGDEDEEEFDQDDINQDEERFERLNFYSIETEEG
jgi:hypothetical protein